MIEAKSRIAEMKRKSGSDAKDPESIEKISDSLKKTQRFLGACLSVDWFNSPYFQYANRLAHLYWFREIKSLPAFLTMLYFLNDTDRRGPSDPSEWKTAIQKEEHCLGIPDTHPLSDFVVSVFVDIKDIKQSAGRS